MRNRGATWKAVVVLVMAMAVIWLGACAAAPEAPKEMTTEEAMVDGDALLQASCTKCHNLDRVTSKQKSSEDWGQTVDNMIQKGAQVADKEALVAYLAETYGP